MFQDNFNRIRVIIYRRSKLDARPLSAALSLISGHCWRRRQQTGTKRHERETEKLMIG